MINTKVPAKLKKDCPDCQTRLIEVRWAEVPEEYRAPSRRNPMHMYPKLICEPRIEKTYHEYRFACAGCKKEWVYNSLSREFWEVPKNAQFYYSWEKELLVIRRG